MKTNEKYVAPSTKVQDSRVRCSILVGSDGGSNARPGGGSTQGHESTWQNPGGGNAQKRNSVVEY